MQQRRDPGSGLRCISRAHKAICSLVELAAPASISARGRAEGPSRPGSSFSFCPARLGGVAGADGYTRPGVPAPPDRAKAQRAYLNRGVCARLVELVGEDVIKFCRYIERITALPLSNLAALYSWLPKSNASSYIKADIEFRKMADRAEGRMSPERAASLARQITEFADERLVAAAMPAMISHRERLLSGHGPDDQERRRKWVDALLSMLQVPLLILRTLLGI